MQVDSKRVLLVVTLTLLAGGPARAIDVSTCDQIVPRGETGILQADLSGCERYGVVLEKGARLELNGHTISAPAVGVYCFDPDGRYTVRGPGTIVGSQQGISVPPGRSKLAVSDVDIHDTPIWGIYCYGGGRIKATRVTVRGSGFGAPEPPGPEYSAGVSCGDVVASEVTVSDNAGYGFFVDRLRGSQVIATGNGHVGVYAYRSSVLRDSQITGNDGFEAGYDIASFLRPRLVGSICGLSSHEGIHPDTDLPGPPWGVCANDP